MLAGLHTTRPNSGLRHPGHGPSPLAQLVGSSGACVRSRPLLGRLQAPGDAALRRGDSARLGSCESGVAPPTPCPRPWLRARLACDAPCEPTCCDPAAHGAPSAGPGWAQPPSGARFGISRRRCRGRGPWSSAEPSPASFPGSNPETPWLGFPSAAGLQPMVTASARPDRGQRNPPAAASIAPAASAWPGGAAAGAAAARRRPRQSGSLQ